MKHIRKFNESKKEAGRVLQEFSSPDGAGTYTIEVGAEDKRSAKKLGMVWLKKNRPHLIDRAQFIINEVK